MDIDMNTHLDRLDHIRFYLNSIRTLKVPPGTSREQAQLILNFIKHNNMFVDHLIVPDDLVADLQPSRGHYCHGDTKIMSQHDYDEYRKRTKAIKVEMLSREMD